ncbi:ATP-binding protein [Vibrio parahaemolyticus]
MFSLFTRLYVGLVTGLALTVALFLFMGEEYMRKTEVGVFLNDGAYFVDQYTEQRGTPDSLYKKLTENGKQDFFIFDLTLVENWDGSPPCRDCKLLHRIQGIPVYLIDGSTYAAVFPLPNTSKSLVFKEKTDFFSPDVDWNEDSEIVFILTLLLVVVCSLGIMVYIPVRRLDRQIRQLTAAQQQFGYGELNTRVDLKQFSQPVKELAQGFNCMSEEVERRVRQTHIFTQAIPHEVRTPLSRIQLATDLARRTSGEMQAELHDDIEDDGPGIPKSMREEVFMPFSRLDKSRNADVKGFGLGLAIATSAVRQLGWELSVGESHLGGARFTVLIPAND